MRLNASARDQPVAVGCCDNIRIASCIRDDIGDAIPPAFAVQALVAEISARFFRNAIRRCIRPGKDIFTQ